MNNKIVTSASSLKLISVDDIRAFALHNDIVRMLYVGVGYEVPVVPGSIVLSDIPDANSIYIKKHSFKIPYVSKDRIIELNAISQKKVIAVYIDESGNKRVSGTSDYPLELICQYDNGLYSCNLSGKTNTLDAFLVD